MKEKELLKTVTDRQMPDLEAIRKNCINQTDKKQSKAKIFTFKSSRFIAAAAVSVLAFGGMIAALAMPGGLIFKSEPESKPVVSVEDVETESQKAEETHTTQSPDKASNSSSGSFDSGKNKKDEKDLSTSAERCMQRMKNAGYEIDELYDLGKAGDYHICLAKSGDNRELSCEYIIGDYVFSSDSSCSPYPLALFAVGHEQTYTLAEAYSNGIFGEDFDDVVELVENAEDVGDFSVRVDDIGEKEVHFRNLYDNPDTLTLANLGTVGETEICFVISDVFSESEDEVEVGKYTFSLNSAQPVYPLGLFVVYYDEVYTLEEALELKIIDDLDAVIDVVNGKAQTVPYNWTVGVTQPTDDGVEETEVIEETGETQEETEKKNNE